METQVAYDNNFKDSPENTAELEKVILQYWPQINYRVKKSLGFLNSDWEDVAGDVLMDVLKAVKTGKFRGDSSLGTFIYTITSRRIIDYIRKKSRVLKHAPEAGSLLDPHEACEQKEQSEILFHALHRLRPRSADMLYMAYFLDLSRKEIAQTFGISYHRTCEILKEAEKSLRRIIRAGNMFNSINSPVANWGSLPAGHNSAVLFPGS
jgi:RNA polymerase sigma-70 factor (ECF subfamily)